MQSRKTSELVKFPRPKSHKLYCFDWSSSSAFVFSSTSFIHPVAVFLHAFSFPSSQLSDVPSGPSPWGQISIAVLSIRTSPPPPLPLFNFLCPSPAGLPFLPGFKSSKMSVFPPLIRNIKQPLWRFNSSKQLHQQISHHHSIGLDLQAPQEELQFSLPVYPFSP